MRVLIVGAGIVGLMCAHALMRRGLDVRVLDQNTDADHGAWRATSPNAACMLGPVSECLHPEQTANPAWLPNARRSLAMWRELAEGEPLLFGPHLQFNGAALIADTPARSEALEAFFAVHGAGMVRHGDASWFIAEEGVASPRLLNALSAELGVRLIRGACVERVTTAQGQLILTASGRAHEADKVVFATGPFVAPALMDAIAPLRHIAGAHGALIAFPGRTLTHTKRFEDCYLTPQPDGAVVAGATMQRERADWAPDLEAEARLLAVVRRRAPELAGADHHMKRGVRPMTPDWAPMIGAAGPDGCFVAVGHGRNGWLLAPLTARLIADQLLHSSRPPSSPFDPHRFEEHHDPRA